MDIKELIIRRAVPSDALLLAKLAEKTFRAAFADSNEKENFEKYVASSFTERQIKCEILDRSSTFFIAILSDKWVGYTKLFEVEPPACVTNIPAIELARLYSLKEYLGCGIGPALLETCLDYARDNVYKSIWLGSWKENRRGNSFYQKMKFTIVGTQTFALGDEIQEDFIFAKLIL